MAAPIPVGFANISIVFESLGDLEEMVTTIAVNSNSHPNTEWATRFETALIASGIAVAANFVSGWVIKRVECDFMTVDGIISTFEETNIAGSGSGDTPPTNCAMLVHKRTALGGRKNRGRMYWPPIMLSETNVDRNGTIASSPLATIRGRFTSLFDNLTLTQDLVPYILHEDGSVPTEVTLLDVDSKIATQRRRLRP